MTQKFDLTGRLPLIAIIRGVTPDKVLGVAKILVEEGFSLIEVPLNSPDALTSIKMLVDEYGKNNLIGAGTVTTAEQAEQVIATGANLMVTPNCNTEVIKMSVAAGCATFPGIVTPTEAFAALAAGATGIKLFPISMLGLDGYKALNSVLPKGTLCYPVGGIEPRVDSMKPYIEIGAAGFGLGSALYKPGMSHEQIRQNAKDYVNSYQACLAGN
ncbi:2-dehydro-3-deoxy-6-phosphogalactonate aldolase [Paraglaciecola aquimarina]|uniref:2-dehydro-3-deoxy-6-phosphogalactonate aldolase n=1 Tax=Paraglaciecola algarum TaxID=3050085 RepID=A0ABS9D4T0_9ALTE|nr:2-dehydro-3-deoxy-6-phosphogalactonate aldolase [Paraglaciecola sp. G1-23]MCF2947952.1 2-dehydro-3-deoxy-6-phosphogalactonate aldolase [Paraglaciecola sp. G1-23]